MTSETNKPKLAEELRKAELYLRLQNQLEIQLREGFVAISGIRMTARSGVLLLLPMTWPDAPKAEVLVDVTKMELLVNSEENGNDAQLRQWCGGFKPSSEVLQAKQSFRRGLDTALEIVRILSQ
jgi:hypothetical protein